MKPGGTVPTSPLVVDGYGYMMNLVLQKGDESCFTKKDREERICVYENGCNGSRGMERMGV